MRTRLRGLVPLTAVTAVTAAAALTAPVPAAGEPGGGHDTKADKGCYIHLFDGDDFDETDDNFKLTKPGSYKNLDDLPGADEDWTDEADSAKVGSAAKVKIWKDTNFEGKSKTLKPGSEHPSLDPEPSSLKMTCSDDAGDQPVVGPAAVARGKDGVDVFARNTKNNHVMHQRYADGSWLKKWTDLGGNAKGAPAVTSWGKGRLDVFATGQSGHVFHKAYRHGDWTGWVQHGNVSTDSGPAAVSWGKGRVDIVANDANHHVRHMAYRRGSWMPKWSDLGGNAKAAPTITSWGKGRLDIFATGQSGHVFHKAHRSGDWTGWVQHGNVSTDSGPAAVSWGNGRVDIAANDTNHHVRHMAYRRGSWMPKWSNLEGNAKGAPAITSSGANQLDVFATGAGSGKMYVKGYKHSWSTWNSIT